MALQIILIVITLVIAIIGYFINLSREELKKRQKVFNVVLFLLLVFTGFSIYQVVIKNRKEKGMYKVLNTVYESTKHEFKIERFARQLKTDYNFFLGKWLYDLGDYDKAAEFYVLSIESFPNNPYSYNNLAAILIEKIMFGEPIEDSILVAKDIAMSLLNTSESLFRKEINKTKNMLEKSDLHIGLANTISNQALISKIDGNLAKAESLYIIASNLLIGTENIAKCIIPYNGLASIYSEQKRVDKEEEWLKKAIERDPDFSETRWFYGEFLLSQKRYSEARIQYFSALRKIGVSHLADILYQLAMTSDMLGEQNSARLFLEIPLHWEDFQRDYPEYYIKFNNALKQK